MKKCPKCSAELNSNEIFCPKCGANTDENVFNDAINNVSEKFEQFNNTIDTTYEYSGEDISKNRGFAILAYFGLLFLIPLLAAPNSPYARYHTNQGILLFIVSTVSSVTAAILNIIGFGILSNILNVTSGTITLVFMIIGIINASQGRAKELPIIGSIRILK